MKPGRTNYQIWILDYLDGRLEEEQAALLMNFLDENPDIREEFNFLADNKITPGNIYFSGKYRLKKTISDLPEDQFELLCVGALENDLSVEQYEELLQYIKNHPDRKNTFNQIQKIKLRPSEVKFRYKYQIRKSGAAVKTIRLLIPALSAAASMAVVIWLSLSGEQEMKNSKLVSQDDQVQIIPEAYFNKPDSSASNRTESLTSELTRQINGEIPALTIPSAQISESPEETYHEYINLSALSLKDNISLFQMPSESLKPDIKFNYPTFIAQETNHGIKYQITKFVREKILKTESGDNEAIKSYEIAEAGIKGLNKLLGWQMSFYEFTDKNGELLAINFNSKLLKLTLPVKRNESEE